MAERVGVERIEAEVGGEGVGWERGLGNSGWRGRLGG